MTFRGMLRRLERDRLVHRGLTEHGGEQIRDDTGGEAGQHAANEQGTGCEHGRRA